MSKSIVVSLYPDLKGMSFTNDAALPVNFVFVIDRLVDPVEAVQKRALVTQVMVQRLRCHLQAKGYAFGRIPESVDVWVPHKNGVNPDIVYRRDLPKCAGWF